MKGRRWFSIVNRGDGFAVITGPWFGHEERELAFFRKEAGLDRTRGEWANPSYEKALALLMRLGPPDGLVGAQRELQIRIREQAWEEYGL